MDYVYELLAGITNSEGIQRGLFIALVAGAVFVLCLSGEFIFTTLSSPFRRRLVKLEENVEWQQSSGTSSEQSGSGTSNNYLEGLSKLVLSQDKNKYASTQAQLIRAGMRSDSALNTYYAIRSISLVVTAVIALFATRWFPELSLMQVSLYVIGAAYLGFTVPGLILDRIESKRVTAIRKGFPDALDLFVVCVESGLGLTATIPRVARELEISHPELAEELGIVSSEIRLGVDRVDALRGLSIRTGLDEIRGLVALIDQSIRFGTGIAETLRVYSEEFRDKRTQMAEEEAAKIGTKMIFPLTFCIWPGFFLVAIGPAIIGVIEAFK